MTKQNRMHIAGMTDHTAAAAKAWAAEGAWVMVSVYRSIQAGDTVARSIRRGRMDAYRPQGAFDAYVAPHDDGGAVWVRALSSTWHVEPLPVSLVVRVPNHDQQRGDEGVRIETVTIRPTCPRCGGPRGIVRPHSFVKDGARLVCDTWTNSCGHQDTQDAVLAEARAIADRRRDPQKGVEIEGVEGGQYTAAVDLLAVAVTANPWLKAVAAAHLLEHNGHSAAAKAVRKFIDSSPTRWNTSGKACALFLMAKDAKAATGEGASK